MAASHRLKLLVIIAAVVSAFRMCEHHVSKMMEVIEKESVMELVEVWYQCIFLSLNSASKSSTIG
jgi:hypothetical protein